MQSGSRGALILRLAKESSKSNDIDRSWKCIEYQETTTMNSETCQENSSADANEIISNTDQETTVNSESYHENAITDKDEIKSNTENNGGEVDTQKETPSDSNSKCSTCSSCTISSSKSDNSDFSSDDSIRDPTYAESNEEAGNDKNENDVLPIKKRKVTFPAPVPLKKVKKPKKSPSTWKKNLAKTKRSKGESYETIKHIKKSDGSNEKVLVTKSPRCILPPCTEKCPLKCTARVFEVDRERIFQDYWSLADTQRQRDFIGHRISQVEPLNRRCKPGKEARKPNHAFYFNVNTKRERVCKTFFISTLGITDRVIRTVIQKTNWQNGEKIVSTDNRGKHRNHNKTSDDIKNSIRNFINSIPRISSHYIRAESEKEYIEGGRTIAQLHRDYVQLQMENNAAYGNYLMFNEIFNREFNISRFQPKKDKCNFCTAYEELKDDNPEKEAMKNEYSLHNEEKRLSQLEKETDKNSKSFVAVYDLQAVLPCPAGDVSSFYYVSKLNVHNLTISRITPGKVDATCYVWHEGQAQRGANEIGTCVFDYLTTISNSNSNKSVDVIFYSDNCGGQNKNKFIITMYIHAIRELKNINSITHKYLIVGHTQNEGDAVHSVIENQKKKHTQIWTNLCARAVRNSYKNS